MLFQTGYRARTLAAIAVLAAAWLAAPPASPQTSRETGTLEVAKQSDRGDWNGTWYYVSRDFRIIIWMRTTKGKPELQLQYRSAAAAEGFVTDWTGEANYEVRRVPANFAMKIEQGDLNTASGSWDWTLDFGDSSRVEKAGFKLYRAGDGRSMVVLFEDLERVVRRGSSDRRHEIARAWSFRKASRRHVRWDEVFP